MRILLCLFYLFISHLIVAQTSFSSLYNTGFDKYQQSNYNAAIADFTAAIKVSTTAKNQYDVADAYRLRAYCKMYLGNYKTALADVDAALKIKPEYSYLYTARTSILLNQKEYKDCIIWADKGLQLIPENEDLILKKGWALFHLKEYDAAANQTDTILVKINPRNLAALDLQSEVKRKQKDYATAITILTKVININAQVGTAFYNRGLCRAELKDFEGALADINRGMAIDSNEKWIGLNNIAFFIYFAKKDYLGSIAFFDKAIALNATFAYAYNNRGFAKIQLKDLKGARTDIEKSIQLSSENSYAYKTYGQLLLAEDKTKQACEKFKLAITLGYNEDYDNEVNELILEHCK